MGVILIRNKMREFRRHLYEHYTKEFSNDERYNFAYKKVREIKRFYWRLTIYFIVNTIVIISLLNNDYFGIGFNGATYGIFDLRTYTIAIIWGIFVLIGAYRVFGRDFFFGDEWEQKKIQKIMEKEAQNKNKWE